jgi:hypothetical protein
MRRFGFFLLPLFFAFFSCNQQRSENSQHQIYGKWTFKDSFTTELVFFADKKYSLKTIGQSTTDRYEIIDDSSAKLFVCCFDQYKLKVNAKIGKDGKLNIECSHSKDSQGRGAIDLPTICNNYQYQKVEE